MEVDAQFGQSSERGFDPRQGEKRNEILIYAVIQRNLENITLSGRILSQEDCVLDDSIPLECLK